MKALVGVDLGATAVRAAKVSGIDDDGFAVVESFGVAPLRSEALGAGRVRNPQAVAHALLRALKACGAKPGQVVVGISAPDVAVARIALPAAVKPAERVKAIRSMGVQIGPAVPTNDAALSTNLVRTEETGDGRKVASLVVSAALSEDVDAILNVCKIAGISPRALDLSGAGTLRALVRDLPTSRDTATIVDIGATQTSIITREGLHLRSIRAFPGGGIDLTRAIAHASKESFEEAERRKYAMRLPSATVGGPVDLGATYGGLEEDEDEYSRRMQTQTTIEQALANAAEMLVDQIAQGVEMDATNQGVMTRHLALCGGTALMRGLKERLQRRLGVEVRIGHPWARLARTKANAAYIHNGREDPRLMLSLATATGLSLWRS